MSTKSYALTTTSRLSSYLGIATPTGTTLTLMEAMIDAVTEVIEDYLGYRVQKTTYTNEEYDTEEGQVLLLKNFPVVSASPFILYRRTSALNEDDWEVVDSEYYHVDNDAGIIEAAGGWEFSRTIKGYRVTYTAGYDYDNTTTYLSSTKGGGIELAAWKLLSSEWGEYTGSGDIQSERIGDYSVTYAKGLLEDDELQNLLNKYSRHDELGVITPLQL
jgi:hypothetical protein